MISVKCHTINGVKLRSLKPLIALHLPFNLPLTVLLVNAMQIYNFMHFKIVGSKLLSLCAFLWYVVKAKEKTIVLYCGLICQISVN